MTSLISLNIIGPIMYKRFNINNFFLGKYILYKLKLKKEALFF